MIRTDDRAGTTLVTALFDIASREANDRRRTVDDFLRLSDLVLGADVLSSATAIPRLRRSSRRAGCCSDPRHRRSWFR